MLVKGWLGHGLTLLAVMKTTKKLSFARKWVMFGKEIGHLLH